MPSYTTYLPQKFKLEGENDYIQLPAQQLEKAQDEPLFILWVSPEKTIIINFPISKFIRLLI